MTQPSVCIPRLDPSLCLLSCRCASGRSAALLGHLFSLWLTFHNKSDLAELLSLVNSDKLTATDTVHLKVKVSVGEGTKKPSHPNWVWDVTTLCPLHFFLRIRRAIPSRKEFSDVINKARVSGDLDLFLVVLLSRSDLGRVIVHILISLFSTVQQENYLVISLQNLRVIIMNGD